MDRDFIYDYEEYEFDWTPEEAIDRLAQLGRWSMDSDDPGTSVALHAITIAGEALWQGDGNEGFPSIMFYVGRMAAYLSSSIKDRSTLDRLEAIRAAAMSLAGLTSE